MSSWPTVWIRPTDVDRVLGGHPWIYERAVSRVSGTPEDGGVVLVKDRTGRPLGMGFYNGCSKIRVRLLSREKRELDEAFFEERIGAALDWRKRHLPAASSYRLVNSESDFLSGLIVDRYEDVLVMQTSSLGMDQRKGLIVRVLEKLIKPRAIAERNDVAARRLEGLEESHGVLCGEWPSELTVRMNGMCFTADLLGGHKTGLYLDQQANYRWVEEWVRRSGARRVLDCFSFQGGFALHAARGGAAEVTALEQSAPSVAVAERNAQANGVGERIAFVCGNVFDWLKEQSGAGGRRSRREGDALDPDEGADSEPTAAPSYDLVILDPPSFTRSRASVPDALRGYKEIHLRALRLLRPGGMLATFCCSHHVDAVLFQEVIEAAALDARALLRRVASFSQSLDHPVVPSIPETEYLKGYAFEKA